MAAEMEPADEPYEQLVRQQLDALGYDSAAIPDDVRALTPSTDPPLARTRLFRNRSQVLRAFLKDFDDKMEIQDGSSPMEASADLPGVASSDPTSVKAFGEPWATEADAPVEPVARPASARLQGARRVSTAPSSARLQGAPAAKRAAPVRPVSSSPAGRSRLASSSAARLEPRAASSPDEPGTPRDAGDAEFSSVHWAALRPSSAPSRPPTSSSSFIRSNTVRTRVRVGVSNTVSSRVRVGVSNTVRSRVGGSSW